MTLVLNDVKTIIVNTIKLAVGPDLKQAKNPDTGDMEGIVIQARKGKPMKKYPHACIDLLTIGDIGHPLTATTYDADADDWAVNTHQEISFQIKVLGGDATQIAQKLKTAYRRTDMLAILRLGGLGLAEVKQVTILPELLQTDFLEVGIVNLSVRVNDRTVDTSIENIEYVQLTGTLETGISGDIAVSVDTTP